MLSTPPLEHSVLNQVPRVRFATPYARIAIACLLIAIFQACSDAGSAGSGAPTAASGNAGVGAGTGGEAPHEGAAGDSSAGLGGSAPVPGADSGAGGVAGLAEHAGGVPNDALGGPAGLVAHGQISTAQTVRPAYGALLAVNDGARAYVVESRRDLEAGPLGVPWRVRFRLAAYDAGVEAWAFNADPDDVIGDVTVHPSGELTLSVERFTPTTNAFVLVRLSHAGELVSKTTLTSPVTPPASDYAAQDPHPMFAMKSEPGDATVAGWVRLLADGEGLVVAFLSYTALPENSPPSNRRALGLETLDWQSPGYVERWARVVEGPHFAQPVGWAYDEFRWRDQAIRPFLARDDVTGELLVGRAWNQSRCQANVRTFAEFGPAECLTGAVGIPEVELVPFAVTRFDSLGARKGTRILRPDPDAAEQLAFGLAAHDGQLATVGSVVRALPDGSKKTYAGPTTYVDYDGYIAIYDAEGALLRHHDYDQGHGDLLAGMRWLASGIVAVGASGWDRWEGGMSISRGSSPLFAWLSSDGKVATQRLVPVGDQARHWNLHDVLAVGSTFMGYGFADAPMTHSADVEKTFASLQVQLTE